MDIREELERVGKPRIESYDMGEKDLEFSNWNPSTDKNMSIVDVVNTIRCSNTMCTDTIYMDKKAQECYMITEYFQSHNCNNKYDRKTTMVSRVKLVADKYVDEYLYKIYNGIELTCEEKELLYYDYTEKYLDIMDLKIATADFDCVTEDAVIKIVDKYFNLIATYYEDDFAISSIKEVKPVKKEVIVYE